MLHPSTRKLIDRLAEMTELGKLDWSEGENGSIVYSTEGYSVCLPDGASEIVITSIDGKELERASADELAATMTESGTSYTQVLAGMAGEASRVARGTEAAISSLLAGMDEPEPAPVEAEPETLDQEDPGDEVAAMASEGIVAHAVSPSADIEPETTIESTTEAAPEADDTADEVAPSEARDDEAAGADAPESTTADDAEKTETVALAVGDAEGAEPEAHSAADEVADVEQEDMSGEVVSLTEDTGEALAISDDESDAVDTESDVTEAVARLADEVNNRDDADTAESAADATSAVGAAAATAVGAVASAAGLDAAQSEADADEATADAEPATQETVSEVPVEPVAASTYVPFGLETPEAPEAATFTETAADIEDAPTGEPESDPDPASADIVELAPAAETLSAEPEGQEAVETLAPSEELTAVETAMAADADPVEEPVDAAPQAEDTVTPAQPQTYSLSGIGAGFGLGALSARTEASGIPGPSSDVSAPAEKIVIDATDDVLPEIEGNLNQPLAEKTASEISFGNAEAASLSDDDAQGDELDGDILKPRTRFNPWD